MKQAVILAAGEGLRLRPFTVTKPKAMLLIGGKPIIQYVIETLAQSGIRDIILIVGYRREQVFDYIGSGEQFGVEVTYITQPKQLGTAHALLHAKGKTDKEFLVLPGDKLIEPATIGKLISTKTPTVLVKRVDNPLRYGVVIAEKGKLKSILEKPEKCESNVINTGIYAFNTEVLDSIDEMLDIPDVLNKMLASGKSIAAVETDKPWLDTVYPWDILSLNDYILHQIPTSQSGTIEEGASLKGDISIGKGTLIRSHTCIAGPVVIGEGCDIGPGACIFPSTSIGNNVVVSPFTEIRNSVIGNDVRIGSGSIVQDSVIDKGCVIGGNFTACSDEAEVTVDTEHHTVKTGAMMGEGCRLGNSVTVQPGAIIGNYSQIKSLKLVSGRLPDKSLVI